MSSIGYLPLMSTPTGCCDDTYFIDFSKMDLLDLDVKWMDRNFLLAALTIIFNPVFWNVIARWEYKSRRLSSLFGSAQFACAILSVGILVLGAYRDWRFQVAIESQPRCYALQQNWVLWAGYACIIIGCVLVFTSFWGLGFYGTFLGDYFGILMEEKVTTFPFNVIDDPMYLGSTLNFLGMAFVKASVSGIVLSVLVAVTYQAAIMYEGPFTRHIYEKQLKKEKSS
ncbi:hypothetical protein ScPMuIL_002970 [Solemya velum]